MHVVTDNLGTSLASKENTSLDTVNAVTEWDELSQPWDRRIFNQPHGYNGHLGSS